MKSNKKIIIYSLADVFYDSFYIKGLQNYYKTSVSFDCKKFPHFTQGTFAFMVINGNDVKKIIIDSRDQFDILPEEAKWCDVYGKVNYRESEITDSLKNKIIPIGPSFGIRIWNPIQFTYYAKTNFLKSKKRITNLNKFLANYKEQYKRLPIEAYVNKKRSVENYIFFAGTIWRFEQNMNKYRALFVKVCRNLKTIHFEGALTPRKDGFNDGLAAYQNHRRYSIPEYFEKIKKTMVVFNTPAVLSCHGWKLGEFLALGKAIISTQHVNVLPAPLIENEDVLYVDENNIENDFENLILKLSENPELRTKLEKNARKYFETYLAPSKVIEILDKKV